ncbi:hypothetical protein CLOSTASPAR_03266 [[Clostridium] asparagiforme DSM 15981]|uniref:Uncharacterized protein n=1 Tax=[Clostridium] asparagiforme DSM 15981 TaxID=518636 RepID=C0D1X8_9FIRM|nr:hypothetical protein CLOSTASPAR_03266 [[Clostridium] asparagiforme DSM 15981]
MPCHHNTNHFHVSPSAHLVNQFTCNCSIVFLTTSVNRFLQTPYFLYIISIFYLHFYAK